MPATPREIRRDHSTLRARRPCRHPQGSRRRRSNLLGRTASSQASTDDPNQAYTRRHRASDSTSRQARHRWRVPGAVDPPGVRPDRGWPQLTPPPFHRGVEPRRLRAQQDPGEYREQAHRAGREDEKHQRPEVDHVVAPSGRGRYVPLTTVCASEAPSGRQRAVSCGSPFSCPDVQGWRSVGRTPSPPTTQICLPSFVLTALRDPAAPRHAVLPGWRVGAAGRRRQRLP